MVCPGQDIKKYCPVRRESSLNTLNRIAGIVPPNIEQNHNKKSDTWGTASSDRVREFRQFPPGHYFLMKFRDPDTSYFETEGHSERKNAAMHRCFAPIYNLTIAILHHYFNK